MTMDARDQFPVDMVEQMLKFTPSPEERALLDEHADEIDHLARADRFLFELSKYEPLEFYTPLVTLFFQDNTLRTKTENSALQEKVQHLVQRDQTKNTGRLGGVQGSSTK